MKNTIKFSEDGTEFVINFANGAETADITSKEEGFKAITKLAKDKKITVDEFSEMRDQILATKKLPWSKPKEVSISVGIMGGNGFLQEILTRAALHSMDNIVAYPDEPVKIAYFKMCESCHKHGRIYTSKCYTGRLDSKPEAILYLEELKERGDVTEEEFLKVKTEIEASTLSKD